MDKEIFARLYTDKCFINFCNQIDRLREQEYKIRLPLETAMLLLGSGIEYTKGDRVIASIHNLVKEFLNSTVRGISKNTAFYDYFVITTIMQIADGEREQLEKNKWQKLPLDLTEYANSICKFDTCTCGYKPKVLFSNFISCLTGKVTCEKCNLSINILFTHEVDFFHGDSGTVYVNLEIVRGNVRKIKRATCKASSPDV